MELRQLRYFVALAEELSFTRAARKLHVSQPPLSFQIASLEQELGVRLFHRTSRSVELSAAGEALLAHARAVLERLEDAREHVRRVADGLEGRVRVGLAGSHFLGPFPAFLREYRARRPLLDLSLQEMRPVDQLSALREGRIDLSLARRHVPDGELRSRLLWRDPIVAVVPPTHRLATRKMISLLELAAEPFVFLKRDSSWLAQHLHDACVEIGMPPRIVQEVVEVPSAVNLVVAGIGVSLVPRSLAQAYADAVATCRLREKLPPGDVHVLTRASEAQPAVLEFVGALLTWAQGLSRRPHTDP